MMMMMMMMMMMFTGADCGFSLVFAATIWAEDTETVELAMQSIGKVTGHRLSQLRFYDNGMDLAR